MPRARFFCEQFRFPHQCGNSDVSSTYPRPPCYALPNIHMEKIPVVHADASACKLRYLQREFVHSLQRQPRHADIRSQPCQMLAVRHPADLLIVSRASITRMHDYGRPCERSQGFQPIQQFGIDLHTSTAATTQFFP